MFDNSISYLSEIVKQKSDVWKEKKIKANKIAEKMIIAGYYARGMRMKTCSEQVMFGICKECGKMHVIHAELCRDKMCPTCSWRLAQKRFVVMLDVLKGATEQYSRAIYTFATLTVKNCNASDLHRTINAMSKNYNRLLQQKCSKNALGWARAVEVTYNATTHQLHPHYHIIIMWENAEKAAENAEKWSENWLKLCEKSGITATEAAQDVRYITAKDVVNSELTEENATMKQISDNQVKAVLETFKYSVKSKDLEDMPLNVFREFVQQMNGLRMISFGGKIKEIKKKILANLEEMESEEKHENCTYCGSEDVLKCLLEWSGYDYAPKLIG